MADDPQTTEPKPAEAEAPIKVGDGPAPARLGESTIIDYWYDLSEKSNGTREVTTYAYGMPIGTHSLPAVSGQPQPWKTLLALTLDDIDTDANTYGIMP